MDPDALSAALAGSLLKDFVVQRKIGGKDVTPGGMAATLTMHGVCSYVYAVLPCRFQAGELALKVMINVFGDQTVQDAQNKQILFETTRQQFRRLNAG